MHRAQNHRLQALSVCFVTEPVSKAISTAPLARELAATPDTNPPKIPDEVSAAADLFPQPRNSSVPPDRIFPNLPTAGE
jgi:hypothetical protein